jgi:hypothetical protein
MSDGVALQLLYYTAEYLGLQVEKTRDMIRF